MRLRPRSKNHGRWWRAPGASPIWRAGSASPRSATFKGPRIDYFRHFGASGGAPVAANRKYSPSKWNIHRLRRFGPCLGFGGGSDATANVGKNSKRVWNLGSIQNPRVWQVLMAGDRQDRI